MGINFSQSSDRLKFCRQTSTIYSALTMKRNTCNVSLVHTADKTKQDSIVLSAVWTELATHQDCRRQEISTSFCPVSKCDDYYWKQCLLVANFDHTTDTDKTRQDSFVLSVSVVWTGHKKLKDCFLAAKIVHWAVKVENLTGGHALAMLVLTWQMTAEHNVNKRNSSFDECPSDHSRNFLVITLWLHRLEHVQKVLVVIPVAYHNVSWCSTGITVMCTINNFICNSVQKLQKG